MSHAVAEIDVIREVLVVAVVGDINVTKVLEEWMSIAAVAIHGVVVAEDPDIVNIASRADGVVRQWGECVVGRGTVGVERMHESRGPHVFRGFRQKRLAGNAEFVEQTAFITGHCGSHFL